MPRVYIQWRRPRISNRFCLPAPRFVPSISQPAAAGVSIEFRCLRFSAAAAAAAVAAQQPRLIRSPAFQRQRDTAARVSPLSFLLYQQQQHLLLQQQYCVCLKTDSKAATESLSTITTNNNSSNTNTYSNCSNSTKTSPQETMKRPAKTNRGHCHSDHASHNSLNIMKWGLSEWSNFAAVLCALDCTILPLLTAAIPFAGLLANSQDLETVHEIARWVALYVVLPLGGFAVSSNFLQLRKKRLFLMGVCGLGLVFASHAWGHEQSHDHKLNDDKVAAAAAPTATKQQQQQQPQQQQHSADLLIQQIQIHHSLVSFLGASLLLASNFLSHRLRHRHSHQQAHCCSSSSSSCASNSSYSDSRSGSRSMKQQHVELSRGDSDADDRHARVSLLRGS